MDGGQFEFTWPVEWNFLVALAHLVPNFNRGSPHILAQVFNICDNFFISVSPLINSEPSMLPLPFM
ncbi:hypothetical protein VP01_5217g1 [Puccinia sorghi]|uniref:Uncharacterized protein n=1 Tax=Puccinia sorghi TaxID=27349 RepID=A0A0L6ULD4_9BASI|nr:hypothetical protein VP01_5217g1 [Puccinia sorghi]